MQNTFGTSRLARLLGGWHPVDADPSGLDVAERLGLWLNAFDAIGLQAAHQAIGAIRAVAPRPRGGTPSPTGLAADVLRLRTTLAQAIARPVEDGDTYPAWQQRHAKLQRDMEQSVAPLRDHVRQALAASSARLRRLAALDAVLEPVLAAREQKLLPAVGPLLEARHRSLRAASPGDGNGGWLDTFRNDWQQALLAELELRLEPVMGLLDALHNESKNPE